jgi:hypothetical protein
MKHLAGVLSIFDLLRDTHYSFENYQNIASIINNERLLCIVLYIDSTRRDPLNSVDSSQNASCLFFLLCLRSIRARAQIVVRIHLLPTRRLNRKTIGAPTTRDN